MTNERKKLEAKILRVTQQLLRRDPMNHRKLTLTTRLNRLHKQLEDLKREEEKNALKANDAKPSNTMSVPYKGAMGTPKIG